MPQYTSGAGSGHPCSIWERQGKYVLEMSTAEVRRMIADSEKEGG